MAEQSKSGKAIYLRCGAWLEKDGSIHITVPEDDSFHCSVTPDPASWRGHPTLFRNLAKCLRDAGAPAPPQDSESSRPEPTGVEDRDIEDVMKAVIDGYLPEALKRNLPSDMANELQGICIALAVTIAKMPYPLSGEVLYTLQTASDVFSQDGGTPPRTLENIRNAATKLMMKDSGESD